MSPEGFVQVNPSDQWCDDHWADVLSTMDGPDPINGILATIRIFKEWMRERAEADTLPPGYMPDAINAVFIEDCPLCCKIGNDKLEAILATCIVPERFRQMEIREGHILHMQEEVAAVIVEMPSTSDALPIPSPTVYGGPN